MSSSGSESDWSESESDSSEASVVTSEFESVADRLRRNDESYAEVEIHDWESDVVEILDALKTNSVVKEVFIFDRPHLFLLLHQVNHYLAFIKLLQVIKINKSVECLLISLSRGGLLRGSRFATMVTGDG